MKVALHNKTKCRWFAQNGSANISWFVKNKSLKQELPIFQSVLAYIGITAIPRHIWGDE